MNNLLADRGEGQEQEQQKYMNYKTPALRENISFIERMEAGHVEALVEQDRTNITIQVRELNGKQSCCERPPALMLCLLHKEINCSRVDDQ